MVEKDIRHFCNFFYNIFGLYKHTNAEVHELKNAYRYLHKILANYLQNSNHNKVQLDFLDNPRIFSFILKKIQEGEIGQLKSSQSSSESEPYIAFIHEKYEQYIRVTRNFKKTFGQFFYEFITKLEEKFMAPFSSGLLKTLDFLITEENVNKEEKILLDLFYFYSAKGFMGIGKDSMGPNGQVLKFLMTNYEYKIGKENKSLSELIKEYFPEKSELISYQKVFEKLFSLQVPNKKYIENASKELLEFLKYIKERKEKYRSPYMENFTKHCFESAGFDISFSEAEKLPSIALEKDIENLIKKTTLDLKKGIYPSFCSKNIYESRENLNYTYDVKGRKILWDAVDKIIQQDQHGCLKTFTEFRGNDFSCLEKCQKRSDCCYEEERKCQKKFILSEEERKYQKTFILSLEKEQNECLNQLRKKENEKIKAQEKIFSCESEIIKNSVFSLKKNETAQQMATFFDSMEYKAKTPYLESHIFTEGKDKVFSSSKEETIRRIKKTSFEKLAIPYKLYFHQCQKENKCTKYTSRSSGALSWVSCSSYQKDCVKEFVDVVEKNAKELRDNLKFTSVTQEQFAIKEAFKFYVQNFRVEWKNSSSALESFLEGIRTQQSLHEYQVDLPISVASVFVGGGVSHLGKNIFSKLVFKRFVGQLGKSVGGDTGAKILLLRGIEEQGKLSRSVYKQILEMASSKQMNLKTFMEKTMTLLVANGASHLTISRVMEMALARGVMYASSAEKISLFYQLKYAYSFGWKNMPRILSEIALLSGIQVGTKEYAKFMTKEISKELILAFGSMLLFDGAVFASASGLTRYALTGDTKTFSSWKEFEHSALHGIATMQFLGKSQHAVQSLFSAMGKYVKSFLALGEAGRLVAKNQALIVANEISYRQLLYLTPQALALEGALFTYWDALNLERPLMISANLSKQKFEDYENPYQMKKFLPSWFKNLMFVTKLRGAKIISNPISGYLKTRIAEFKKEGKKLENFSEKVELLRSIILNIGQETGNREILELLAQLNILVYGKTEKGSLAFNFKKEEKEELSMIGNKILKILNEQIEESLEGTEGKLFQLSLAFLEAYSSIYNYEGNGTP